MRVLYCNKYNYRFSGTEVYLFDLMELMRSNGHEVALFSMADDRGEPTLYDRHFVPHIDFKGRLNWPQTVSVAAHAIYSTEARRRIRAMIREFRPDVAHIRGIYHHLSPSVLWALRAQGIPILYHLNDFKLLSPNYNLVAKGHACEKCKGGHFGRRCERDAIPAQAPAQRSSRRPTFTVGSAHTAGVLTCFWRQAGSFGTSLSSMDGTVRVSGSCRISSISTP